MRRPIIILWCLMLITSCKIYRENQPGAQEFKEILQISIEDEPGRFRKFSSYSIEKQVDIYLYGMDWYAPPYTTFGDWLAYDGKDKIPYILERIKNSRNNDHKFYLKTVIRNINKKCNCVSENDLNSLNNY